MSKDPTYIRLINTKRWHLLRKEKLSHDPLCEVCREKGKIEPATEVHHIRPVEDGLGYMDKERLMFNYTNLQSLCHRCHVQAHKDLGRVSKEGNKRRTATRLKSFIERFLG